MNKKMINVQKSKENKSFIEVDKKQKAAKFKGIVLLQKLKRIFNSEACDN
jgi:hypothetical protein